MRSKLLSLADCTQLISSPITESMPLEEIRENVERDLQDLCLQHKQVLPASTVALGDTVKLSLASQQPKFNRKGLYLCVGANLFDADLEASLQGKSINSTYSVCIGGQDVTVSVEQCLHTVIPEPSDEWIARLELDGIATLEAYRLHAAEKHKALYREYYLEYLASEYTGQWFDASSWEIEPEELEEFYLAAKRLHDTECEAHDTFFLESYPGQLEEMLREDALRYLQSLLAGCLLFGGEAKALQPDLEHAYARKAAVERIWKHVAQALDPHFTLNWEEDT